MQHVLAVTEGDMLQTGGPAARCPAMCWLHSGLLGLLRLTVTKLLR